MNCTNFTSRTPGSIIPHNESYASVKRYLKKVSNNVNQIVTKMVWNAHSRTVNLLANDGKEGVYFWDHHKFDNKAFSDFSPDNTDSLVHQLQESWHRAWDPPQMVRYTTKDYPIGKHCSYVTLGPQNRCRVYSGISR